MIHYCVYVHTLHTCMQQFESLDMYTGLVIADDCLPIDICPGRWQ